MNLIAICGDGTRAVVNTFVSGYVKGAGKWSYIYHKFKPNLDIPRLKDKTVVSWEIQLESNAKGSMGADCVLDDIRVYASTAKPASEQTTAVCDNVDYSDLDLRIPYTGFMQSLNWDVPASGKGQTRYFNYVLLNKDKFNERFDGTNFRDALSYALIREKGNNDPNRNWYGTIQLHTEYDKNQAARTANVPDNVAVKTANNTLGVKVSPYDPGKALTASTYTAVISLTPASGISYFDANNQITTVTTNKFKATAPPQLDEFHFQDQCAMATDLIIRPIIQLKVDGVPTNDYNNILRCRNQSPIFQIDQYKVKADGMMESSPSITNAYFDWYTGTAAKFTEVDPNVSLSPFNALQNLRSAYPDAETWNMPLTPIYSRASREILKGLMEPTLTSPPRLVLRRSSFTFPSVNNRNTVGGRDVFVIIPINSNNIVDSSGKLCFTEPFQITVKPKADGTEPSPYMKSGFYRNEQAGKNGYYPDWMNDVPIRMTLEQLKEKIGPTNSDATTVTNNKQIFSLPVRYTMLTDAANNNNTLTLQDVNLYLSSTTDETYKNMTYPICGKVWDFNAYNNSKLPSQESRVNLTFFNQVSYKNSSNQNQTATFQFREGHEYTFRFNFRESAVATSIYTADNCPCYGEQTFTIKVVPKNLLWVGGQDGNYNWNNDDNWRNASTNIATGAMSATLGNSRGFAPIPGTNVIIGSGAAPILYDAGVATRPGTYAAANSDGLKMDFTDASVNPTGTYRGVATGEATPFIESHMIGARTSNNLTALRPWKTFTVDKIHLLSGAEMLNLGKLTYGTASVDIEATQGIWQLMSSPLQGVVAGDFYMPKSTLRENTPIFNNITYNNTNNNRFTAAIYQRSWNRAKADIYSGGAYQRSGAVNFTWSDVFNDIKENYSTDNPGFSLKPGDDGIKAQGGKVSVRLPKADTQYYYTNEDGTNAGNAINVSALRTNAGKLKALTGTMTASAAQSSRWFLFGNPFTARLDMQKFLEANKDKITQKFWTIDGLGQRVEMVRDNGTFVNGDTTIAPYQGFFVEALENTTSLTLNYNDEMATTTFFMNNGPSAAPSRAADYTETITITAMCDTVMSSKAVVLLDPVSAQGYDANEDAVAIFDPQTSEAPVVYTTAGDMATAINALPDIERVEIGVNSPDNERVSTLTISGGDSSIKLVDTETDETRELGEDITIEVKGSTAGRYYLTRGAAEELEQEFSILAQGNVVTVKLPGNTENMNVMVFDTLGRLIFADSRETEEMQFSLDSGTYAIKATTPSKYTARKFVINPF